jgi:3-hydroxyacyl-CoA dehydrogenase
MHDGQTIWPTEQKACRQIERQLDRQVENERQRDKKMYGQTNRLKGKTDGNYR